MSDLLTKEQILKADDIKTERVEVPEWGGAVLVRGLDGAGRGEWDAANVKGEGEHAKVDLKDSRLRLVARCMVNDKGQRLFSDVEVALLRSKSAAALCRVSDVAERLAGISSGDIEDAAKNSDEIPPEDSG